MKIEISDRAFHWFQEEVGLKSGDKIRFYTRIYGSSPVQEGYALAFTIDNDPRDAAAQTIVEDITFYIEETDLWFFDGHDLFVVYNEKNHEVEYKYIKP